MAGNTGGFGGRFFAVLKLREGILGNLPVPVAPERSPGIVPRCVLVSIVARSDCSPVIFPVSILPALRVNVATKNAERVPAVLPGTGSALFAGFRLFSRLLSQNPAPFAVAFGGFDASRF